MTALVDSPVAQEALAKVGVMTPLVTLCAAAAKRHRMVDGSEIFCHK